MLKTSLVVWLSRVANSAAWFRVCLRRQVRVSVSRSWLYVSKYELPFTVYRTALETAQLLEGLL